MADRKITDMSALAAGSQATDDVIAVVDVSEVAAVDKNKKMTMENLFKGIPGDVGIGTSSPSEQLEISSTGASALSLYSADTSISGTQEIGVIYGKGLDSGGSGPYTGAKIAFTADGTWDTGTPTYYPTAIKFYTQQAVGTDTIAAGPRMVIDSSGRVGIGTATPGNFFANADNLVVGTGSGNNGITIYAGNTSEAALVFADGTSGSEVYISRVLYNHNTNSLQFDTSALPRMNIDSDGRVLIGTTSSVDDTYKLQVVGTQSNGERRSMLLRYGQATADGAQIKFQKNRSNTGGTSSTASGDDLGQLLFQGTDQGGSYRLAGSIDCEVDATPANNTVPGRLVFYTTPAGTSQSRQERITIKSDGKIGIGTTAPQNLLILQESNTNAIPTNASIGPSSSDTSQLGVWNINNSGLYSAITLETRTSGAAKWLIGNEWKNTYVGDLFFRGRDGANSSSEFMRITSSGDVGIGTASPTELLTVSTSGSANQFPLHIENRANYGWGVGLKFRQPLQNNGAIIDSASILSDWESENNSTLEFATTRSGSRAEKMRIDSSGNVGIGTTSPVATLHVDAGSTNDTPAIFSTSNANGPHIRFRHGSNNLHFIGSAPGFVGSSDRDDLALRSKDNMIFATGDSTTGEAMRIDSSGKLLVNNTGANQDHPLQVTASANSAHAIAINARASDDIGELTFFSNNRITRQGEIQYRNNQVNIRHRSGPIQFASGGVNEVARLDTLGRAILNNTTVHGTSSRSSYYSFLHIRGNTSSADSDGRINLTSNHAIQTNGNLGSIYFSDKNGGDRALIRANMSAAGNSTDNFPGYLTFWTNGGSANPTERMRIDSSGRVLIGTTTYNNTIQGVQFNESGQAFLVATNNPPLQVNRLGGDGTVISIRNDSSQVGTISVSGSTTAYNESSDYRLKENVVDIIDGITRVKQLQPRRFNFIVNPDTTVDGFLAHEAQTVVPEAVTGTHNEVDDDGDPVMQGIDKSKLVPLLTAALKEAIAKIETLEAKVAALEAG